MIKVCILLVLTFLTSCGSLRITPQNCKSRAFWSSPEIVAEKDIDIDSNDSNETEEIDIKKKEPLFIFFNTNLRLQELLNEYNTSCGEIKKLRLEIKTTFFFWREVNLIVEN